MLPFNRLFLKTKNVCTGFEIFLKRGKDCKEEAI